MSEKLVEKVARNVESAVQMQDFGHRAQDGGFRCTKKQAERLALCCDDAARDAIRVTLEEAINKLKLLTVSIPGDVFHAEPEAVFEATVIATREEATSILRSLIPSEEKP